MPDFILVPSERLLAEYDEVLKRPKFGIKMDWVDDLLATIRAGAHTVEPVSLPAGVVSDPKDAMVLGTAVAGKAVFFVTGDRKDFPGSYRGTQVLLPGDFLTKVAEEKHAAPFRRAVDGLKRRNEG